MENSNKTIVIGKITNDFATVCRPCPWVPPVLYSDNYVQHYAVANGMHRLGVPNVQTVTSCWNATRTN